MKSVRPWISTLGLGSAQLLAWGSTYYLPAILAQPMSQELGISNNLIFGAFSAALIVAALLGPFVGRRIDHLGGRHVLMGSNLCFAAGLTMLGVAQNGWMILAAWLILGVGMASGLYEAAFSTLTNLYGHNARSAIIGITLFGGLASTVCWPISAYLDAEFGWRAVCLVWAAAHIVIGLPLNGFLVPKRNSKAVVKTENAIQGLAGIDKSQYPTMVLLSFVFVVAWFTSTAMVAHLPRLLQDVGVTAAIAIGAAALVGPAQLAGRLLEYGFFQRFHPLLSARLATLAHPLGVACLLIFGMPALFLFPLLHGIGNGILTIAMGTLPLAIFGPSDYGLRQGLMMMPARFVQAGAPFLFGLLLEHYGSSALLLSATLGIAAFLALVKLKPMGAAKS